LHAFNLTEGGGETYLNVGPGGARWSGTVCHADGDRLTPVYCLIAILPPAGIVIGKLKLQIADAGFTGFHPVAKETVIAVRILSAVAETL
jgi:hypothetical protein